LGQSQLAPEIPGITDITQLEIFTPDFLTSLAKRLANQLCFELEEGQWTEQFSAQAGQLQRTKYLAASWTERR